MVAILRKLKTRRAGGERILLIVSCILLSITFYKMGKKVIRQVRWQAMLQSNNQTRLFDILFSGDLFSVEYNKSYPYPWRQIDNDVIYRFNLSDEAGDVFFPKNWNLFLRQNQAERLKKAIQKFYLANVNQLSKESLIYECTRRSGHCAGFGNRLIGIVGVFYASIGLGRNFGINWDRFVDVNEFFDLSAVSVLNKTQIEGMEYYQKSFMNSENEEKLAEWLADSAISEELRDHSHVFLSINSLVAIESVLKNPYLKSRLIKIFDNLHLDMTNENLPHPIDGSVLASAALQIVFAHPSKRLENDYNNCLKFRRYSYKIGIHIRFGDGGTDSRITAKEVLECFPDMIADIVRLQSSKWHHFDIFLASDREIEMYEEAETKAEQTDFASKFLHTIATALEPFHADWRLMTTNQLCPHYHVKHSEWNKNNSTVTWKDEVKTYIEWLALTRMDFLIITRSSYGEMAALHSLKPAVRFREKKWFAKHKVDYCSFHHFNLLRAGFRFE